MITIWSILFTISGAIRSAKPRFVKGPTGNQRYLFRRVAQVIYIEAGGRYCFRFAFCFRQIQMFRMHLEWLSLIHDRLTFRCRYKIICQILDHRRVAALIHRHLQPQCVNQPQGIVRCIFNRFVPSDRANCNKINIRRCSCRHNRNRVIRASIYVHNHLDRHSLTPLSCPLQTNRTGCLQT